MAVAVIGSQPCYSFFADMGGALQYSSVFQRLSELVLDLDGRNQFEHDRGWRPCPARLPATQLEFNVKRVWSVWWLLGLGFTPP